MMIRFCVTQLAISNIVGVKKEVADLTKKENKIKTEKVDVDEKMKTYKNKLNECKGTIHQLEVKVIIFSVLFSV